jgi:PA domain
MRRPLFLLSFVLLLLTVPASAANLLVVVTDPAGQGFNDPAPATPVGGNMGTTVGDQRLNVFKEAARIWSGLLPSNVDVRINSSFQALTCDAQSAVLGSAGATSAFPNFPNSPLANTNYPKALADKLAGFDNNPALNAIKAQFNSELGKTGCLTGAFFYLGLDNNPGNNINLLSVVLHEFGHGLGFASNANSSGTFSGGRPGIFDSFLLDTTTGKTWDQMVDTDRVTSAVNTGNLRWNGSNAAVYANAYMSARARLVVTAPAAVAGTFAVGTADFGPPLAAQNVSGPVVAGLSGSATDGCSAITSNVSGNIALLDRGTCNFTVKVKNAQNAGAIAAIIVDNVAQGVAGMSGTDATITIPSIRITLTDGTAIRAHLPATASLGLDPALYAGADSSGRLLMFAPNPYQSGSSVSHWDTTASPNLLMEPNISSDLNSNVDATLPAFRDIGWFLGSTALPTTYVLPSSARVTADKGAFYTTSLTVTNTGSFDSTLTIKFLGNNQDGRTGAEVTRTVPAGQTVSYPDVLNSLFAVTSGFGAIRINADTNLLKIVSQTSTPPPSGVGTFGQAVPALAPNDLVTPASSQILIGLRQDAAFRTNAVIANATEADAHVDLMLYSSSGSLLGSQGYELLPLEMRQISKVVTALGAPDGTANTTLVVSTSTGGARIATYAAVIDQTTNDPRTILGIRAALDGNSKVWLLPSSAHRQGQNGAFYKTDVTLVNASGSAANFTLKFLGHEQDGRNGAEKIRTVAANSVLAIPDVLGTVFGVPDDYGAIRFSADQAAVRVVSQTSTPPPSGVGTFGQAVPGFGPADYATAYAPKTLAGLRQDSSFRTNAVIANATDQPVHVDLTLKSETGATLGTGAYDLLPYEMRQIGTVVTTLGAPDGTANTSLVVSTPTAGGRVATYAAIIDQTTNDPRTVLP